MKTGNISVQSENIFPIIKQFLYSDQEIFLRELVSNAMDATSKMSAIAKSGEFNGELGDLSVKVTLDKDAGTLTISDRGIGMTEEEVDRYLNQVAFSSAQEFLDKYKDAENIIGHFGLGFYSAFMVSDKVDVITKSYKDAPAVHWSCKGDPSYEIGSSDKTDRGTDIILHISEDAKEYLEQDRIQALLDKYCKFLPYPLQFGMKTEVSYEGEGEDRKEIKTEVPNIINEAFPIWKKQPADLTDEDYKNFYQELYPFSPEPLFWIHMNIDYPFNLTGILYFPQIKGQLEVQKDKIQLYSNQVYVTDDVSAIVPEFLTLLHGVIDSPDIPLNVSRSYLQADQNVKKITSHISKKVSDKLKEMFKEDRKNYESKWDQFAVFVKYGMLTDDKFNERLLPITLFKNIDKKYSTLEEYKDLVKANQTDKNDKIAMIYTQNKEAQKTFIDAVSNKGYDVLLMDQMIDNHFMQQLEMKDQDIRFVRVDSDSAERIIPKEENIESVLNEKETEKVQSLFEGVLGENVKNKIALEPLSPDAYPVMITRPEFMRRYADMQRIQNMGTDMPSNEFYQVVVNTNNPLIADKLLKMRSEEKKENFVSYLYDLARLDQGMLNGEEMTGFIKKSLEFVG